MASYLSAAIVNVSGYSRDVVDSIGEASDLGQGRTNSSVPVKVVTIIKYRVPKTESDCNLCACVWSYLHECVCMCERVYIREGHLCKYAVTCRPRTTTL